MVSKVGKIRELLRTGFFSPLQEAVRQSPQQTMPLEQWERYLQPGRTVQREGIQFPLKQAEVETALSGLIRGMSPAFKPESDLLIRAIEVGLPQLQERVGKPRFSEGRLSHHSPGSAIEESVTELPGLNYPQGHYGPDTLSWSRTTSHQTNQGPVRLVEEIQSDIHQQRQKIRSEGLPPGFEGLRDEYEVMARRAEAGELSEEEIEEYEELRGMIEEYLVPDAPYSDPKEYAQLELSKQLLKAAEQGEEYLALTRGSDQIERYQNGESEQLRSGMKHFYDKIYPSVMKKLGKRYGAEMIEVEVPVDIPRELRFEDTVRTTGFEPHEIERNIGMGLTDLDDIDSMENGIELSEMALDDINQQLTSDEQFKLRSIINRAEERLEILTDNIETLDNAPAAERERALQKVGENGGKALHVMRALFKKVRELGQEGSKTFPALKLTPEVREKIKKAGVPLFGSAGATAVLPEEETEVPTFQKGGKVKGLLEVIQGGRTFEDPKEFQLRIFADPERLDDPDYLTSKEFRDSVRRQLAETLDDAYLDPRLVDQIDILEGATEENLQQMVEEWAKTMGRLPGRVREEETYITVPMRAERKLVDRLIDDDEMEFQEGGPVEDTGLRRFREILEAPIRGLEGLGIYDIAARTRQLDPLYEAEDPGTEAERDRRLMALMGRGLASQVMGMDPETGRPAFAPLEFARLALGQRESMVPLGLADEVLALPTLMELWGGEPPEFATQAAERQAQLVDAIEAEMGVGDPEGFREHTAESLGMMLSQIPLAPAERVGEAGEKLSSILRRTAEAPIEFLAPVVSPSLANYLTGALFGGTIGATVDALSGQSLPEESPYGSINDLVMAAEEGDEEAQRIVEQMLKELEVENAVGE